MSAVANPGLVVALLAGTIGLLWLCIVGMCRSTDAFSRLHFTGAAALFGPPGIAVAVCIAGGLNPTGLRAWLISAILLFSSGIITHATARAELLRRECKEDGPHEERKRN
jgi:multisubunit Na+/H+ antiporter MnhG subunit